MTARLAHPWRIVLAVAITAACTGSGSASLVDIAVGQWSCTVRDVSAHQLGSFEAQATIARNHRWTVEVREPAAGSEVFKLEGGWQLQGTSVLLRFTRPDHEQRHVAGAAKRSRAISMFVGTTREGDFAVTWKGDDDVTLRQTASNGSPSVPGGDGDAWIAECKKIQ